LIELLEKAEKILVSASNYCTTYSEKGPANLSAEYDSIVKISELLSVLIQKQNNSISFEEQVFSIEMDERIKKLAAAEESMENSYKTLAHFFPQIDKIPGESDADHMLRVANDLDKGVKGLFADMKPKNKKHQ